MKINSIYSIVLLLVACWLGNAAPALAQVTTSVLSGYVVDEKDEPTMGATIIATHTPSGTEYGTTTDADGHFTIPNVRVGGPYTIKVTYVGYKDSMKENYFAGLGQSVDINVKLNVSATDIAEVVVTSDASMDAYQMGTQTNLDAKAIAALPTVNRSLNDFLRLTPQASLTSDGGISIAGMNNRYNAIFIDGAVNNDVFGLSASGTNGGQTGISPISIDAIEQFQVSVSPYDVRQSGFAGAAINAVTRSGTNKTQGSAYYFLRNQALVGLTPTWNLPDSVSRTQTPDFTAQTFGFRLGGALVKNKVFYFINAEMQRDNTPNPFNFSSYNGTASASQIQAFEDKLNGYGYDPGTFTNNISKLYGEKIIAKIDWNINQQHKLSIRHSYTAGRAVKPVASTNKALFYDGTAQRFPTITNSTAIELNSSFKQMSNKLVLGFTNVLDDRNSNGSPFPYLVIKDGSGYIYAGTEEFSSANQLKQNILTLTDNFNWYLGKHTLTFGTHNEFYNFYNLFIRQNYGTYYYDSLAQFLNDAKPTRYERSYSLVDNITGDGSAAAAKFNALQLGVYVQDEYAVSKRVTVTGGIRLDVPFLLGSPKEDTFFNNNMIPLIESYGYDLKGARAGQSPKAQLLVSPRLGFNADVFGDKKTIVRGGVGIFTSRVPFVWPGGAFTNNGLTIGGVAVSGANTLPFNPDPFNQYTASSFGLTDRIPSGEVNLFAKNFKYPQVFRTSVGFDQKLPEGVLLTIEGMYTKTLNNIYYENLNQKPFNDTLTGSPDDRLIMNYGSSSTKLDSRYGYVLLGSNTNKGYTYNVTAQLRKEFRFDDNQALQLSAAYTFGRAYAIFEGTSSQNSSQWRGVPTVESRNNAPLGRSDFDMGHRVTAFGTYTIAYAKRAKTMISIFYNGQSGAPYSFVYGGNLTREDSRFRNLIYVPNAASEIHLVADGSRTVEQQWAELDQFISNDPYLSKHRGEIVDKNMNRTPFTHIVDLRLAQDVFFKTKDDVHTVQLTLDVFNITNLLNKNWGRTYTSPNFGNYELITFKGFEADGTTPRFTFPKQGSQPWGLHDMLSRWRMQVGIRYIFN